MEDNAYQYYCSLCSGIRMLSTQIAQGQQAPVPSALANADMEQLNQKLAVLNENMGYLNQAIVNQETLLVQILAFVKENAPAPQLPKSSKTHSK